MGRDAPMLSPRPSAVRVAAKRKVAMNRNSSLLVAAAVVICGACASGAPASQGASGGASGGGGSTGSASSSGSSSGGGGSSGTGSSSGSGAGSGGVADSGSNVDAAVDVQASSSGAPGADATPPRPDGPISSGGGGTALETLAAPPSGASIMSMTSLTAGSLYLLRARGTVALGAMSEDAKFTDFAADGTGASATGGGVQVTGFAPPDAKFPPATGENAWFGDYRADHVYYMLVIGGGGPLSFKLVKPGTGNPIAIAIFLLTSPTSMIGNPIESVKVPMIMPTPVSSMATTEKGAVYVLEGAGTGVVGGGKLGDAEYDDFSPTGTGALEGEGGVDFGIGVDEPNTKANYPRLRKWGPIRNDHIYFMLFAGTGSTVSFTYYDSVYTDNGKTDMLTATLFAAP